MNNNKTWMPLGLACAAALLIYLGVYLERHNKQNQIDAYMESIDPSGGTLPSQNLQAAKLMYILNLVNNSYVDTVNMSSLVESAIPALIKELDPHSVYIPASELQETNEQLDGSFSGIGIQFNIQNDTVMVIQVISGGPSERVGIMPGDRIVTVDDSLFVGKKISNDKVLKTLRGPKGSIVKVGIKRSTSTEILPFDIERGDIPVNSVIASYVVSDSIGYIKIDNFGRNTYKEFFTALVDLKSEGAKGYIVDLRGNGGGFMEVCARMVNEFLDQNDLILYTEGKNTEGSELCADGRGSFKKAPIVVLIDEWSASASEIFSGTIQDNDRGTIIGRRSFGKGLVQQQFELKDGSALRLTIARYHIPSGRCIQKPYKMGDGDDYSMDLINRYEHGEFYSKDSIQVGDTTVYKTAHGRIVYGGGGIMPDIFIPSDTLGVTPYYNKVINAGLCYSFAFRYADEHREKLSSFSDYDTMLRYLKSANLVPQFVKFASSKVPANSAQIAKSNNNIERLLIAYIMRQTKDENFFYQEFNSDDPAYLEAIKILKQGKAFPEIQ